MNFEFLLMTERSRRVKHDNALSEGTAKAGAQALSAKNCLLYTSDAADE